MKDRVCCWLAFGLVLCAASGCRELPPLIDEDEEEIPADGPPEILEAYQSAFASIPGGTVTLSLVFREEGGPLDFAWSHNLGSLRDENFGPWRTSAIWVAPMGCFPRGVTPTISVNITRSGRTTQHDFQVRADGACALWTPTASLAEARSNHTASLLASGKVLVTGGDGTSGPLASAELYDPATGSWSATGGMGEPRTGHTATVLPSGEVLVIGGRNGSGPLASAELYDPATGTWNTTRGMGEPRSGHSASLLPSGTVLVLSGLAEGPDRLTSAEVYEPVAGTWSPAAAMPARLMDHTATVLPSGKVLVVGRPVDYLSGSYAEVYDPGTNTWTQAAPHPSLMSFHSASLLPSGKVLTAGGSVATTIRPLTQACIYDEGRNHWRYVNSMGTLRRSHTATLLSSGQVLILGGLGGERGQDGLASAELYDPGLESWRYVGSMIEPRSGYTATALAADTVLIVGGRKGSAPLSSAELLQP